MVSPFPFKPILVLISLLPQFGLSFDQNINPLNEDMRKIHERNLYNSLPRKLEKIDSIKKTLDIYNSLDEPSICQTDDYFRSRIHRSDRRQYLKKQKNRSDCDFLHIINEALFNDGNIEAALEKTNFDPCCIPKLTYSNMQTMDQRLNGFSVGIHGNASKVGIGLDSGIEVVFVQVSDTEFEVSVVKFQGTGVSAGLPFGVGVTQSMLYGDCRNISSYLGIFSTMEFGGMQKSTGIDVHHVDSKPCFSDSVNFGTTTEIVSFSFTNYTKVSETVRIKGPRIQKLLEFFKKINSASLNRSALSDVKARTMPYLIKDYKRRFKNEGIKAFNGSCSD